MRSVLYDCIIVLVKCFVIYFFCIIYVRGTPPARRERGELLRQRLFFRPPAVAFRTIAGALSRLRMACEHAILGG